MKIELFGMGCPRCIGAEENLRKALEELSIDAHVEKVTGTKALRARGVTSPPAIVVDGRIVTQGTIPTVDEVKRLLKNNQPRQQ